MHELSIAHRLVTAADEAAREAGAGRVHSVRLRLGRLSGVVRESLEFCYELVVEGTSLAGSRLDIEVVDVVARCAPCARDVTPASPHTLRCPHCGSPVPEIVRGRELDLVSLEFETPTRPAAATAADRSG